MLTQLLILGHAVTDGAMRGLLAWPVANLVPLPDASDGVTAPGSPSRSGAGSRE